jgi:hypothetical protein
MGMNASLFGLDASNRLRRPRARRQIKLTFSAKLTLCRQRQLSRLGSAAPWFERMTVGRGSNVPRNEGITFQRLWL